VREVAARPIEAELPYEVRWVRPEIVCEVKYLELTPELRLRAPSFRRLRFDKPPEECEVPVGQG
jgi:ATP-dependent DNA ligase